MVTAAMLSHLFMVGWVSLRGFLHVIQVLTAYSVHAALGVAMAILPPLISQLTVGQAPIPALCLRTGILALMGLVLWAMRRWVPGLRLGIARLRSIRPSYTARHRAQAVPR